LGRIGRGAEAERSMMKILHNEVEIITEHKESERCLGCLFSRPICNLVIEVLIFFFHLKEKNTWG